MNASPAPGRWKTSKPAARLRRRCPPGSERGDNREVLPHRRLRMLRLPGRGLLWYRECRHHKIGQEAGYQGSRSLPIRQGLRSAAVPREGSGELPQGSVEPRVSWSLVTSPADRGGSRDDAAPRLIQPEFAYKVILGFEDVLGHPITDWQQTCLGREPVECLLQPGCSQIADMARSRQCQEDGTRIFPEEEHFCFKAGSCLPA